MILNNKEAILFSVLFENAPVWNLAYKEMSEKSCGIPFNYYRD